MDQVNLDCKFFLLINSWNDTFTIIFSYFAIWTLVTWLVVLGLQAILDSISVYIGPFPREGERDIRTTPIDTYCKRSKSLPH